MNKEYFITDLVVICEECCEVQQSNITHCIKCGTQLPSPDTNMVPEAVVKQIQDDALSSNLLMQKIDLSTPGLFMLRVDAKRLTRDMLEYLHDQVKTAIKKFSPESVVMILPDFVRPLVNKDTPEAIARKIMVDVHDNHPVGEFTDHMKKLIAEAIKAERS